MLPPLPLVRIAYAAASAAANLPPTATDHVTLQIYWGSSISVASSAQRNSVRQINGVDSTVDVVLERHQVQRVATTAVGKELVTSEEK